MTTYKLISKEQALTALDNLDDYARMADIDPIGPLAVLRRFIENSAPEVKQEPAAWISQSTISSSVHYGPLPVQSLQPRVYKHTPLYALPPDARAEIARLKAVIEKCEETLISMDTWFKAESAEDFMGTTFYQRMDMCNKVENLLPEAIAAINEVK